MFLANESVYAKNTPILETRVYIYNSKMTDLLNKLFQHIYRAM